MAKTSVLRLIAGCFDYCKKFGLSEIIIRRNPLYYKPAKELFNSLKQLSFTEKKNIIDNLLSKSLQVNTNHIKKFDMSKVGLDAFPLIDKTDIQESPGDFLGFFSMLSIPSSTGGSTGVPLNLKRSFPSIVVEQAAIDSIYQMNNINLRASKLAVLRGDSVKDADDLSPPYWKYNSNRRILYLSSQHLNIETIRFYLDELDNFSPDAIYAYPSAIEFFVYLLEQSNMSFKIPLVVTSSEVFTPESRKKVSRALSCISCDYYGQAERISFAYSNKVNEYYFLSGYSYVELEFKYSEKEYDYYEIIGTSLWNKVMPIQRYCTGDLAILPQNLNSKEINFICLGIKPFYGILGRKSEYLLSPDGTHLIGINQIPKFIDNVAQMQFIQNTVNNIDILVIPRPSFSHEDEAKIIKSSRKKIPESMNIKIIKTTQLEKTKSQKTPLVIRKIN